jgi:hypothetical protein
LISQLQDDLPYRQRLLVKVHLLFCDACTHFERQLRFLRVVMTRYRQ